MFEKTGAVGIFRCKCPECFNVWLQDYKEEKPKYAKCPLCWTETLVTDLMND
jgi:hypothetical protein